MTSRRNFYICRFKKMTRVRVIQRAFHGRANSYSEYMRNVSISGTAIDHTHRYSNVTCRVNSWGIRPTGNRAGNRLSLNGLYRNRKVKLARGAILLTSRQFRNIRPVRHIAIHTRSYPSTYSCNIRKQASYLALERARGTVTLSTRREGVVI